MQSPLRERIHGLTAKACDPFQSSSAYIAATSQPFALCRFAAPVHDLPPSPALHPASSSKGTQERPLLPQPQSQQDDQPEPDSLQTDSPDTPAQETDAPETGVQ